MFFFTPSISNLLRDSSCNLEKVMSSSEVQNRDEVFDDESEYSSYDGYEQGYENGYEDGYIKARGESLVILAYFALTGISLFMLRWKI